MHGSQGARGSHKIIVGPADAPGQRWGGTLVFPWEDRRIPIASNERIF